MLVKLPWGDYVNDESVSAITIDREGTGFVVVVSLDREGMEVRSRPLDDEGAVDMIDLVAGLLEPYRVQ